MFVFRGYCFLVFLFALHTVLSKCKKSTAALLEEELKKLHEISENSWALYDGGDTITWNCTDGKNQSLLHQNTSSFLEEEAESLVSPVAVEESPEDSGIFGQSSSGNSTHLNTFVLVYNKIFNLRNDESLAPSSNIPVQVVANITTEENTSPAPNDETTAAHGYRDVKLNLTRIDEEVSEPTTTNLTLGKEQNSTNHLSHNMPVSILLGERHGITILNATFPNNSILINKTDIDAFSVDFKYETATIVFAGNGTIRSTGQPRVVASTGVDGPVRLAVDWVHDRVYWLSDKYQTVEVADLDGANRTLLTDVVQGIKFPNNIAVDPYQRLLFFAANNTMYRSDLDGRNMVRIGPQDTIKTVRCLALDTPSKRLFFSGKLDKTLQKPYIASSDYEGGSVKYLDIGDTDWKDVYSIDVFKDVLYFAHYDPKLTDSVWAFNTSWTGKRPVKVYSSPRARGGIWSIKVFNSQAQKQSGELRE